MILPWWWRWALLGVLMVGSAAFGAIKMHQHDSLRYEELEGKYAAFKADTKAAGKLAQDAADKQAAKYKSLQEKANDEIKHVRTLAEQRISSLRYDRDHSGQYSLPAAPTNSTRPDLACFDRAELSRADGEFIKGARGLADKGDAAILDLGVAKKWAQELSR